MPTNKKPPTIQDVARYAQVSTATVSRALSNPEKVSATTRERINAAVLATGYTINQSARSLRLRAARTILIALPNIGNPFYSTILDAVVEEAASREYGVIVANRIGVNPMMWMRKYFLSNRADGMLLFDGSLDAMQIGAMPDAAHRFPLVVAADEVPDPSVHAVLTDNFAAAQRAVRHLLDLGHTRMGHIMGLSKNSQPSDRLLGYRAAMEAAGLPIEPDWVMPGDFSMAGGVRAAALFAAMPHKPTAVFAGNDESAIGFIRGLREHGLDCPRDVSVIGFDDINIAGFFHPPLTTMRQPREEIGRRATAILIDLIENRGPRGVARAILRSELVVRASTRQLAAEPAPVSDQPKRRRLSLAGGI